MFVFSFVDKGTFLCSTRWRIAIYLFIAYFLVYAHRVNLSLAVVCMVNTLEHVDTQEEISVQETNGSNLDTDIMLGTTATLILDDPDVNNSTGNYRPYRTKENIERKEFKNLDTVEEGTAKIVSENCQLLTESSDSVSFLMTLSCRLLSINLLTF